MVRLAKPLEVTFMGSRGHQIAAKIDMPVGEPRGYALFAHCFTCSKDFPTTVRVSKGLAKRGIAVLRFDFTGLGESCGDFSETNFSSNVEDILAAADFMREHYQAPQVLIGHSLGGAAVLAAAGRQKIPELRAIATINAPSDPAHVSHHFKDHLDEINAKGEATVDLVGRPFVIKKQFVENIESQRLKVCIGKKKQPLMVMHAPTDTVVGIENAGEIYAAAKHPKNFISLDGADHFLSDPQDADYVAEILSAWLLRYICADCYV